jgi:hypothetical protein
VHRKKSERSKPDVHASKKIRAKRARRPCVEKKIRAKRTRRPCVEKKSERSEPDVHASKKNPSEANPTSMRRKKREQSEPDVRASQKKIEGRKQKTHSGQDQLRPSIFPINAITQR